MNLSCESCHLDQHDDCPDRRPTQGKLRPLAVAIFGDGVTECCCPTAEFAPRQGS